MNMQNILASGKEMDYVSISENRLHSIRYKAIAFHYYNFRWVQRDSSNQQYYPDYVSIFRGNGCFSSVGRVGGMQKLSLGYDCANVVGTPIHEMMHALGKIIFFLFVY